MLRTFREFVELAEGKKKDIKRLKSAYLAGQQQAAPKIVNYGDSAPNSPERAAAIERMMKNGIGGGAVRRTIRDREQSAEKAAKKLLKHK